MPPSRKTPRFLTHRRNRDTKPVVAKQMTDANSLPTRDSQYALRKLHPSSTLFALVNALSRYVRQRFPRKWKAAGEITCHGAIAKLQRLEAAPRRSPADWMDCQEGLCSAGGPDPVFLPLHPPGNSAAGKPARKPTGCLQRIPGPPMKPPPQTRKGVPGRHFTHRPKSCRTNPAASFKPCLSG